MTDLWNPIPPPPSIKPGDSHQAPVPPPALYRFRQQNPFQRQDPQWPLRNGHGRRPQVSGPHDSPWSPPEPEFESSTKQIPLTRGGFVAADPPNSGGGSAVSFCLFFPLAFLFPLRVLVDIH
jgi:hypothetical protein